MVHNFQRRIVIGLMLLALILPVASAKAIPVEETFSVPETAIATKNWLDSALSYLLNKTGTIFFQNILRKYLNQFAMDSAKYIATGGKGQEALYIKEKWGKHWLDVADAAAGDFVESFANSVISDIAAGEAKSQGGLALCERQKAECYAKAEKDLESLRTQDLGEWNKQLRLQRDACDATYNQCLDTEGQGGNADAATKLCSDTKKTCDLNCNGDEACLQNCQNVYESCYLAAGGTIEQNRRAPMFKGSNSPLARVNMCHPSLGVGLQIGLGLIQPSVDTSVNCKFTEMVKNWSSEIQRIKDISSQDFLQRLATMFQPTGSDLSIAFTLYNNLYQYQSSQVENTAKETIAKGGWLDVRNIAGDLVGTPDEAKARKQLADESLMRNLGLVTGDILVDAANIFLNQLGISLWQNLMGNLSQEKGNLSFYNAQQVGRTAIENRLSKLTEPQFAESGKLDILSKLSTCPDPANPGPANCVITSEFSSAISSKISVREAVRTNRLPGNWPFGFNKNGEDKIPYNQGYPYRSLIILRKYRILPVGWELAAQAIQKKYLNNEFSDKPDGITLNDLLACFSSTDDLKGYNDNGSQKWCEGLIDPNWILTIPEYYCAREGFGPQLLKEPDLVRTGVKYCSADNGVTMTPVENKQKPCEVNDDCCTASELERKEKLRTDGKIKELQNFTCGAACTYEEQKLSVYRDERYCADEQSCIKEGRNNSCLFYGYCTEERRKWVFNKNNQDQSCDPLFNTCQSFRATDGKRTAYLANTLDYNCRQSSVGCKEYSYNGTYDALTDKVGWDRAQSIYFNKKVSSCASREEGCHEFIRVKDGQGINLLADAGLEAGDTSRWTDSGAVVSKREEPAIKVYNGNYSLHVPEGARGVLYNSSHKTLLPEGFTFELNNFYTLSAYIYVVSGQVEAVIGNESTPDSQEGVLTDTKGSWQRLVVNIFNGTDVRTDFFAIRALGGPAEFYLDNLKFEIGQPTEYAAYGANSLVYEKLLPAYMEKACYKNPLTDFNYKDDAPAKCQNFVRKCQKEEVGCELYTEVATKDTTAAQTKPTDVCPAECVGYDTFIQKANNFYSAKDEYFIPKTAKTCGAQAVGCSLFVNLDKIKTGGEENEYFSKFRRCIKPDASCGEFYTWEGSDQSGYQLVVYQLKVNTAGGISQPETVDDDDPTDHQDGTACNEDIYALPNNHPDYNPDCRQFYGRDGNVSYHLMSKTITCADTCYPYRLVNNNVDVSIADETECRQVAAVNGVWKYGFWDDEKKQCLRCINGGEWQDEHHACVFMADPTKSQTCGANEAGCSEYEGDFGNNIKVIFNSAFENNSLDGWGPTVKISSDALTVGGHSLQITSINGNSSGWFEKEVKGRIKAGKHYVLSFVAKKKVDNVYISGIGFVSQSGTGNVNLDFAGKVDLTPDWKQYKFDLKGLNDADVKLADRLMINLNGQSDAVRLDNVKLLEMSDTYFLIKNSWTTPASCDQDQQGNPAPLYMLGCKQYTDRDNQTHYLKSFDKLCQESAVGCELMIDTANSSYYGQQTFGGVTIPADKFAYIVYEKKKECGSSSKGCSRLGLYDQDAEAHIKDVYLLNNPDRYNDVICTKDQVGCEAWGTEGGGEVYFKDPGLKTCEFRAAAGQSGWYLIKANRCISEKTCTQNSDCGAGKFCDVGGTGVCVGRTKCQENKDCGFGEQCKLLATDLPCATSYNKTIGVGAPDDKLQPVGATEKDGAGNFGNAGLCPANQSGCTEYIDPESRISYNLTARANNVINFKPYTLYIVKAQVGQSANISCANNDIYKLDKDNNLVNVGRSLNTEIDSETDPAKKVGLSEEFYIAGDAAVDCNFSRAAEVKEAIVNYRLAQSLDQDKPTEVNFQLGQVLFNARTFNGGQYNKLLWNTNKSQEGQAPNKADPNRNNANALLKVDPDRECATWLGCKSYIENPNKSGDKICYERGLCDRMNEAGECISFIGAGLNKAGTAPVSQVFKVSPPATEQAVDITNLSGYSKVGYENNLLNADMYHLANMTQEGEAKVKFNGSFENSLNSGFVVDGDPTSAATVISDAKILEQELGFGSYKLIPDGRAVAKANKCVVKTVDNVGGRYYVVSAYVFLRYGAKVDLSIGDPDNQTCPLESTNDDKNDKCESGKNYGIVASTNAVGRWVRLTAKFSIANGYQAAGERKSKINIGICAPAGMVYFDDVRLEPGLKEKDQTYTHSDCRLYPERDSMSCDYYDQSGLRKKGWAGYCLEYDPRNPGACLLWYPIDKVDSEEYEEGVALNIAKDLYYCLDAEDQCSDSNKAEPEFYCKKFIKVNKDSYWYDRIAGGSNYVIPPLLLDSRYNNDPYYFHADFGVNAGSSTTPIILDQKAGSGYYGAYSPGFDLEGYDIRAAVGNSGKRLLPFVPYRGISQAGLGGKDRKYFCEATLDKDGNIQPIEVSDCNSCDNGWKSRPLGKFDDCYVGIATVWTEGTNDNCLDGDNRSCGSWNYGNRSCATPTCAGTWKDLIKNNIFKTYEESGPGPCPFPFAWPTGPGFTKCSVVEEGKSKKFTGMAADDCNNFPAGDGNEAGCLFECFNHTIFYRLAQNNTQAVEAVKRLFTKSDQCLAWNGFTYSTQNCSDKIDTTNTKCAGNVRPRDAQGNDYYNPNNSQADYCFVEPSVNTVKINNNWDKGNYYALYQKGWVTLRFTSKIDKEQQPLKKYRVDWGYSNGGFNVNLVRNVNMYARSDINNPHIVYYFLDIANIDNCSNSCPAELRAAPYYATKCCSITPGVTITDNWGQSGTGYLGYDEATNSTNRKPLIIYQ